MVNFETICFCICYVHLQWSFFFPCISYRVLEEHKHDFKYSLYHVIILVLIIIIVVIMITIITVSVAAYTLVGVIYY